MNRLVGLSVQILRTLKNRTPGAIRFDFSVQMDLAEFNSQDFGTQLVQALENIQAQDLKGWAAAEKYFLDSLSRNEAIEIEGKRLFLISEEEFYSAQKAKQYLEEAEGISEEERKEEEIANPSSTQEADN